MSDWMKDPEFARLRAEFAASFTSRAAALDSALNAPGGPRRDLIEQIAHKLAGSARSYGFAELGDLAARVEDLITGAVPGSLTEWIREARRLSELLKSG